MNDIEDFLLVCGIFFFLYVLPLLLDTLCKNIKRLNREGISILGIFSMKSIDKIEALKREIGYKEKDLNKQKKEYSALLEKHNCLLQEYKKVYLEYQNANSPLQEENNRLAQICAEKQEQLQSLQDLCNKRKDALNEIFESNLIAFPYLAAIMADYKTYDLDIMVQQLSWGSNVARQNKVASLIEIKKQTKAAIEQCKLAEYQLEYLKTLFPAIDDILETDFRDLDTTIDFKEYDPIRNYLQKDEYWNLTETERNQLALDRYIESHQKSKWQIGRDYELYVGYEYSLRGYSIDYFGSYMGLEDLGRDLIARRGDQILVVQCKYWSKEKVIHEKHIAQLYGTYICYCLENNVPTEKVKPVFITSTSLSAQAKDFCNYLDIAYKELYEISEFPRIKCNIGIDEYGQKQKIYHLPMDQQYDKIKMSKKDTQWAFTVAEAESLGFRRAYKWHGQ